MSAGGEMAAKADRMRAARLSSGRQDVRTSGPPVVRVRPVRVVLDVSPAQHAELAQLCLDLTAALGAGRLSRPGPAQVCGQDVLRALLRRVLADETARAQLLEDLLTS